MTVTTSRAAGIGQKAAARTEDAVKVYGKGQVEVRALDDVTVEFVAGRFTAIMGPSGSGKSTLLHCAAGLDTLTSGQAYIGDADLSTLDDQQLTILRRDHVGFVFQSFNLVPTLTAGENITLPMRWRAARPLTRSWIDQVIETFGLGNRLRHRPQRAVRRPAAAGRGGPGAGQPPGDHLRRRADREPRLAGGRARCSTLHAPGGRRAAARRSSWSPTTPSPRATRTGSCSSPTAGSSTRCIQPTAEGVLERMKRFGE